MKFTVALLSLLAMAKAAFVEHQLQDIKADSPLGMKLLSQARNLNDNNNYMYTWVANYSIKFQGCHQISQWNDEADGDDDVRIATKRLVRFRLCPTNSCVTSSSQGCTQGYGDYIIDMESYLAAYFEAKSTYQSFKCEYLTNYVCGCGDNGNNNENYSEEMCLWDCYSEHNMANVCMENNPYSDDNGGGDNQFQVENYMYCTQASFNNNNNNNNNGENNNNNNNANAYYGENWDGSFYIGPYCASQGGAIMLGVFTDDTCSSFADDNQGKDLFYSLAGTQLPYSSANIVDMDCLSCKEPSENNNDGDDADDGDDVAEVCENIYTVAGKCESKLPSGTVYTQNNNACNYMEGIKIVRKDGTVVTAEAKANKTASIFIGIFVVAFVLLSAYVYYLKTKLDRASINLSE